MDSILKDGDYWLVIDDKFVIASEKQRQVTVDLFRNLDDYRHHKPMAVDHRLELVVPDHRI